MSLEKNVGKRSKRAIRGKKNEVFGSLHSYSSTGKSPQGVITASRNSKKKKSQTKTNPKSSSGIKASRTAFVLGSPRTVFMAAVVTFVLKYFKIYSVVKTFSSFATSYKK